MCAVARGEKGGGEGETTVGVGGMRTGVGVIGELVSVMVSRETEKDDTEALLGIGGCWGSESAGRGSCASSTEGLRAWGWLSGKDGARASGEDMRGEVGSCAGGRGQCARHGANRKLYR